VISDLESPEKNVKHDIPEEMNDIYYAGRTGSKWELITVVCLIATIGIFVFKDFLLFRKIYIFKDIGSDTYNQIYPFYVHISDYLRTAGIPKWSFNQGMGQNIFPGGLNNPFTLLLYMLGNPSLVYGIAYVEILKIVLGGIIFHFYLRTISLSKFATVVGAILFSFSGYMILGSGWYGHSTAVVYGAFLLFSFEKLFKDDSWVFFPVSITLIGSYSTFYLYTFGSFILLYAFFRFIDERGFKWKALSLLLLRIVALGMLGISIGSVFMLPDVLRMIESPRVSGDAGYFNALRSAPVFGFGSTIHNITAGLRFFSNDILGTGSGFRGWGNYLEAPTFYCGTICLLLLPQLFGFLNTKRKILFLAFLCFWILLITFPFFRHTFYLFSGDYYKGGLSFFVPVVVLFFGLQALSSIDRSLKINVSVLMVTFALLLLTLYFPYFPEDRNLVVGEIRAMSTVFLAAFAILIYLLSVEKYKMVAKILVLLVLCVELGCLSFVTVNKRFVVTPEELALKVGFNDYTNEAVEYLKEIDNGFYRVNKDYASGTAIHTSLNDAQIQRYYGTPSYYSFNQKSYISFLVETDIIQADVEHQTRWAKGLIDRLLLQTLASVKYTLCKFDESFFLKNGYETITRFGNVKVLKNKYSLPMGFTYNSFVKISDFRKLSSLQKDIALLKSFIIEDSQEDRFQGIDEYDLGNISDNYSLVQYGKDIGALNREALVITEHGQNIIKGKINLSKKKLLFFSIPYDKGWKAEVDGKEVELELVNIGFMGLIVDKGEHAVELNYSPPYIYAGTIISASAFILFLFLAFIPKKKVTIPDSS